ncbi:sigma-54 interaction domain-containing protein [Clostridium frigidicarnis]|uniref:Arginine utilization regulatory protein n=1 Tax=Clostridium frigidicarnis TaxID=84698 RepID=A0A1I0ZHJ1_9CLOT|nr:sigma 54-interacting transcriptional regulator [Clostridium frigidicarnis]SFB24991.1 arginine utilization regulatory protein [Clostridium frigidicarnis]
MNYKIILETFIDNSDEGIIVTDTKGNITFYKESKNNITGIKDKNPVGKNILDVFPYLTEETSSFYYVLKKKKPIIEKVQKYKNNLGKIVYIVTSTIPIFENNEFVGVFEIFKDLTLVSELSEKVLVLQENINKERLKVDKVNNKNGAKYRFSDIIAKNNDMIKLINMAKKICKSSSPILVYGETGTGKELLVQSIHNEDFARNKYPFIAQNCAAIPENLLESILFGTEDGCYTGAKDRAGLLELVNGGTLFLDEINSMDVQLQSKLLRVIQEGEFRRIGGKENKKINIRIIASTNEKPIDLVNLGRLRRDLYYRLNVIYFEIPPLRKRRDDISILVDHFIEKYNHRLNKYINGIEESALKVLEEYEWPGNVRELENVIERAMNWTEGNFINTESIFMDNCNYGVSVYYNNKNHKDENSANMVYEIGLPLAMDNYEKNIIKNAIKESSGNYSKAARNLKIPKQTLQNKIKKYNIEKYVVLK